nr:immunoglobulin heavy chain junction region [Macaca mulatta]MOV57123.1 immunoglobulin heavy chain junction region [Macaca mulatta]MOV57353.1 immunoglobulin heavy chain junction region [Macaca mulatta]MOV58238.1 immunoglobulin heavy chain junction region [Macaca mulatta]MOV60012.1 immunoglobulin heavy chain junction region [Macaca mulatta]
CARSGDTGTYYYFDYW